MKRWVALLGMSLIWVGSAAHAQKVVTVFDGWAGDLYTLTIDSRGALVSAATRLVDVTARNTPGYSRTSNSKVGINGDATAYMVGQTIRVVLRGVSEGGGGGCGLVGVEPFFVLPFLAIGRRREKTASVDGSLRSA